MLGHIKSQLRLAIQRDVGSTITLRWTEWAGGASTDVVTGGYTGAGTEKSESLKALVHEVNATTSLRQHAEVEVGDLLVDFLGDTDWSGRLNLRFEWQGRIYVQKEVGTRLAQAMGTWIRGVNLTKTVLLKLAT